MATVRLVAHRLTQLARDRLLKLNPHFPSARQSTNARFRSAFWLSSIDRVTESRVRNRLVRGAAEIEKKIPEGLLG